MLKHDVFDIDGLKHGFFTRQNGHSQGIYASLNMGKGSQDNPQHVFKNYQTVKHALGLENLQTLNQIHSDIVVTLCDAQELSDLPRGDALVTNIENIGLGILTADCGPVLLADTKNHVIGAAHMGRRGALGGLLQNTVAAMENLGAQRPHIHAVLGPAISKPNYQIGQDIFDEIHLRTPQYQQHIHHSNHAGKYLLDMHALIRQICIDTGINFHNLERCTYAEAELFFSYRRSTHYQEPDYGRLISVIALS